jgi:hypothetical protein
VSHGREDVGGRVVAVGEGSGRFALGRWWWSGSRLCGGEYNREIMDPNNYL